MNDTEIARYEALQAIWECYCENESYLSFEIEECIIASLNKLEKSIGSRFINEKYSGSFIEK